MSIKSRLSLFDKLQMGYTVVGTRNIGQWEILLRHGLSMSVEKFEGNLVGKIDSARGRILIARGEVDDIISLGIEVAGLSELEEILSRLRLNNIDVQEVPIGERRCLGIERAWRFVGPKKLIIELYASQEKLVLPGGHPSTEYITSQQGFGHLALLTKRPAEMLDFWQRIFDMRLTDEVRQKISGVEINFSFMRCNKRHHSIAFGSTRGVKLDPFRTKIQHLEFQVSKIDDLTRAYENCKQLGLTIDMGIGQHANDRAISFYVRSPSGFDIEIGWNPIEVDENVWRRAVWDCTSVWGHQPEGISTGDHVSQLFASFKSIFKKEHVVRLQGSN